MNWFNRKFLYCPVHTLVLIIARYIPFCFVSLLPQIITKRQFQKQYMLVDKFRQEQKPIFEVLLFKLILIFCVLICFLSWLDFFITQFSSVEFTSLLGSDPQTKLRYSSMFSLYDLKFFISSSSS